MTVICSVNPQIPGSSPGRSQVSNKKAAEMRPFCLENAFTTLELGYRQHRQHLGAG